MKKNSTIILAIAVAVLIAVGAALFIFRAKAPVVEGLKDFELLPGKKVVVLKLSSNVDIKYVEVLLSQGGKEVALLKDMPKRNLVELTLTVEPKKLSLADGKAQVGVKAVAGRFATTQESLPVVIDTVPPELSLIDCSYITDQGSSAAALLQSRDAKAVYIRVADGVYPATNEVLPDKQRFFAIYPIGLDLPIDTPVFAEAVDEAGNKATVPIKTILKKTVYRKDTLKITEDFVKRHVYPMLNATDLPPLEAFKVVNEKWRAEAEEKIKGLTGNSVNKMLWNGAFLQMKNSKVFARFGDQRSYQYDGKIVSYSRHLGFDLASLSNSPVEAANAGVVVFTGDIGIYGNVVIIDHGLGLMSFYAHLSSIDVAVGQQVEKASVIAHSGMTGFAAGDHVHFAMLLHGQYVTPVAWWDKAWIEKRVLSILRK
ncbi:peptidase M23/M37 family protein [Candidatus Magnetobacterium bavaricum]|uniref:Peptidase M23/M37 family protein n=1 Tax=Candidatus Magnetobacterium bavaricum TaxID=29290 RepID=A0A0F3GMY2_9BACT|nr:peptidase M23/M37 family protein [Candidatus Magnetobacterium bavaricum]